MKIPRVFRRNQFARHPSSRSRCLCKPRRPSCVGADSARCKPAIQRSTLVFLDPDGPNYAANPLQGSSFTKLRATHRELRRVPRKTGDGACRYSGSVTVGVERIGSDGKPEVFSLFRARPSSRKFPRFNNMCITSVLLYQYRHCRRPPREKRKERDYDHSTRTLILTLIETLWGDQYLDSVACEGSRSIRPIW